MFSFSRKRPEAAVQGIAPSEALGAPLARSTAPQTLTAVPSAFQSPALPAASAPVPAQFVSAEAPVPSHSDTRQRGSSASGWEELGVAGRDATVGSAAAQPLTDEQLRQLAQQDLIVSAAFARIVSVLMRAPQYKTFALADLEWLVMPPLLLGQFAVLDARIEGVPLPMPAAVALWASVSKEVDARLSDIAAPMRLSADEWRSGEILWLFDVVGEPAAAAHLLTGLRHGAFKDRPLKARSTGPDGRIVVGIVPVAETDNANQM